jgi:hypothetical protein
VGNALPDNADLRAAFADRQKFDALLNLLRQVGAGLNALVGDGKDKPPAAGGAHLMPHRAQAQADYRNLWNAVRFGRPYALCPYPHTKGSTCNGCKGAGWVTKEVYQNAPREYRKAGAA